MQDWSHAHEFLDGQYDDEIKKTIVNALILSTLLALIPEVGWLLSESYIIYMYVRLTQITTVPITLKRVEQPLFLPAVLTGLVKNQHSNI